KGADPNVTTEFGLTVLMAAAQGGGEVEIARLLIDKGARVDVADKSGGTALMYAADRGKAEFVRLLLAKGADVNARDKSGATALKAARAGKHPEVEAILKAAGATE